jgi:hypothetical protein
LAARRLRGRSRQARFGVSHQFFSKVLGVHLLRYTENGTRRVQGLWRD